MLLGLTSPQQANSAENFLTLCVQQIVENNAEKDHIISARQVLRRCGCLKNRYISGLTGYDCPSLDFVTGYQMRRKFTGFD